MGGAHRTVAQNAGQFLGSVGLGNGASMSERLLGALQIFQGSLVIGLILGHLTVGLGFLQILLFGVSGLGNLQEKLVGLREVAVAYPGHGFLHAVVQPVRLVVGIADRLVVLDASLVLISHQGICVAQSNLRGHEIGIDL